MNNLKPFTLKEYKEWKMDSERHALENECESEKKVIKVTQKLYDSLKKGITSPCALYDNLGRRIVVGYPDDDTEDK